MSDHAYDAFEAGKLSWSDVLADDETEKPSRTSEAVTASSVQGKSRILTHPRRDALAALAAIHPRPGINLGAERASTFASANAAGEWSVFVHGRVAAWLVDMGHVEYGQGGEADTFTPSTPANASRRHLRLTEKGLSMARSLPDFGAEDDSIARLLADHARRRQEATHGE